jgi:hypothetical protein
MFHPVKSNQTQLSLRSVVLYATTIACGYAHFWSDRLERLWHGRSVIWFPGVRRAGKTTICRALKDVEYFDCELPRPTRGNG